jgi:hypothetical protein
MKSAADKSVSPRSDQNIAHFKFLKTALQTRFSDFIPAG